MATNVLISCPEDCVVVKFKVKEGSVVNSGTILCEYKLLNAKKIGKLKCNCNGTVRDLLVHEGDETQVGKPVVSIELCRHLTVWRNMCAECGLDLRELESLNASVAMEHMIPDLLISEKRAQVLGKEDELRLLRNRQLVLLVDLDQTLIHTTNDAIPPNLKDVYHFQLWPHPAWYHTKFRPHTERFLERISRLYELHICTFGTRTYAHTIARFLDPDGHYFSQRILSRDECFHPTLKTSNLKALFPCGDTMVCIIDDREDVWKMAPNLVHVRPYRFFDGTADINAPPEASKAGTPESAEDGDNAVGKVVRHLAKVVRVPKKKIGAVAVTGPGEPPSSPNKPIDVTGNGSVGNILPCGGPESKETEVQSESKPVALCENKGCSDATVETSASMSAQELREQDVANQDKVEPASEFPAGETGKGEVSRNGNKDTEISGDATMEADQPVKSESQNTTTNNNGNKASNLETADKDEHLSGPEDGVNGSYKTTVSSSNVPTLEATSLEVKTLNSENTQEVTPSSEVIGDEEYEEMIEWEDLDDYLIYLEDVLTRIHTAYYKVFDQMQQATESDETCETPDLKTIVPYVRRKVLKGARIVFSGVCPLNTDPSACRIYRIAESLGAVVQNEIVLPRKYGEVESTTHMVAARLGTQKVRAALRVKGVKIVNPDWLWTCADRWEWVDERLFPLNDETSSHFLSRDSPDPSARKKDGGIVEQSKSESSAATEQTKPSYDTQTDLARFTDSQFCNPLSMLSKEQLSGMDAEVENFLDEDSDDDENGVRKSAENEAATNDAEEDSSSEDEEVLRQKVLMSFMRNKRKCEESSDEDSLAGDFPKGWKQAEKKRQRIEVGEELEDEEDDVEKLPEPDDGNDSSNDGSKSSKSGDDDFSDSVGSVDDEIAAAVEREFLS